MPTPDPGNWRPVTQLAVCVACIAPPLILAAFQFNLSAFLSAVAGLVVWVRLNRDSRGFPFLFGLLSLVVLLLLSSLILLVIARWIRLSLPAESAWGA